tara:strand:+ start:1816 stop:5529 length:3714 start_codon:yes stop_codon:yes gene_type:complete
MAIKATDSIAGLSRQDRLLKRKESMRDFLKANRQAGEYFLSQNDEGKERLKGMYYSKLIEKNPDFGRFVVGETSRKSYSQMYTGGTGQVTETKEPVYAELYDDKTEYLYDAVDKGLIEPVELDRDTTSFIAGVAKVRGSTKAKILQMRARDIAEEMGIGQGLARAGGLTTGIFKPFADVAVAGYEAVGGDTTERTQTQALLAAAYPERVAFENWGQVLGLLGGSLAVYNKLGQKGLATVVRKEGGKRSIAAGALAATAGAEFGLGFAYNSPTLLGESRVMSGIEAMFLGSALNLAVDAVLPLRGMNKAQATEYLDELDPPKWKEISEGISVKSDEAMPSPQNVELAEQVRDAQTPGMVPLRESLEQSEQAGQSFNQLQGDLTARDLQQSLEANQLGTPTSTPINQGAGGAVTPEMERIRQIDTQIDTLNNRERVLNERRGLSKKERGRLNTERKSLVAERTQLQYNPALTREEQLAEEAMPGSVLGIQPYILSNTPEMRARVMKELLLRFSGGTAGAFFTDPEEDGIGRGLGFALGFIAADPQALKSIGKILPEKIRKPTGEALTSALEPLDQRLLKISPKIFNALRRMELQQLSANKENLDTALPFFDKLNEVKKAGDASKQDLEDLTLAIFNRDVSARDAIFNKIDASGTLSSSYGDIETMLSRLRQDALDTGMDIKFLQDYFPRVLRDYDGLKKSRGFKDTSEYTKELRNFQKEFNRKPNAQERADIANKLIMANNKNAGPTYGKERKLDTLVKSDLKYYSNLEEALGAYIFDITRRISKRRFTGANFKGGTTQTQVSPLGDKFKTKTIPKDQQSIIGDTIGAEVDEMVDLMRASGEINEAQVNETINLLKARLVEGDIGPSGAWSAYRNMHYLTTIGNPFSAVTQVSDIATAATKNASATGNVLGKALRGKGFDIKPEDYGLVDVAEDMMNPGKTGKWLEKSLKYSGFKAMDRIGKATHLSSAYQRLKKAASAPENSAVFQKFKQEQLPRFGDEFEDLVSALRNSDKSNENLRLAVFNELADIQPITLSGMPEQYVKMKGGRLLYALKSFTIKQVDFMRKQMLDKIAKAKTPAEVKEGVGNYARYLALFGGTTMAANTFKDFVLGREITLDDAATDAWMQAFGLTRYSIYKLRDFFDKGSTDSIQRTFGNILFPSRAPGDLIDDTSKLIKGEIKGIEDVTSLRNVPIVGKGLYWKIGEGKEKLRKRKARNIPSKTFNSNLGGSGLGSNLGGDL